MGPQENTSSSVSLTRSSWRQKARLENSLRKAICTVDAVLILPSWTSSGGRLGPWSRVLVAFMSMRVWGMRYCLPEHAPSMWRLLPRPLDWQSTTCTAWTTDRSTTGKPCVFVKLEDCWPKSTKWTPSMDPPAWCLLSARTVRVMVVMATKRWRLIDANTGSWARQTFYCSLVECVEFSEWRLGVCTCHQMIIYEVQKEK